MEHESHDGGESVVSKRTMEVVVGLLFAAISLVVMVDSARIGNGWSSDGPAAGYFPFYVGLAMLVSSAVIVIKQFVGNKGDGGTFVEKGQLHLVLKVLVPSFIYVLLVGVIGIYVASAIFIAFFMGWVGKYPAKTIAPIAILVPCALFVMFEIWFLVPLPKGPLEAMLGY